MYDAVLSRRAVCGIFSIVSRGGDVPHIVLGRGPSSEEKLKRAQERERERERETEYELTSVGSDRQDSQYLDLFRGGPRDPEREDCPNRPGNFDLIMLSRGTCPPAVILLIYARFLASPASSIGREMAAEAKKTMKIVTGRRVPRGIG